MDEQPAGFGNAQPTDQSQAAMNAEADRRRRAMAAAQEKAQPPATPQKDWMTRAGDTLATGAKGFMSAIRSLRGAAGDAQPQSPSR